MAQKKTRDRSKTENQMINLLLVSDDKEILAAFVNVLKKYDDISFTNVERGQSALEKISKETVHLVVANGELRDMTGIELMEKIVTVSPMTNGALIGSAPPKEFHEKTEGLGLMAQISPQPDEIEVETESLLQKLDSIVNISI